jgi:phage-related tail protein
MSANIDNLIKTIAVKHGVAVGRDDPILILHTLNEELRNANEAAMQALFNRQKEELEAMAKRWADDSKDRAEKILNAALAASTQTMRESMEEGVAGGAVESLHQEVRGALGQAGKHIAQARRVALLSMVAAALALAAAGVVYCVVFFGIHVRF